LEKAIHEALEATQNARCIHCGAAFSCNPGEKCWCAERPHKPMPKDAAGCLCPACFDLN